MKNKHLVLLFLLTLLIGLAVRRAPWCSSAFFHKKLLPIDTSDVIRLHIDPPGQRRLWLVRGESGWTAEQKDRSARVSPEDSQKILAALSQLRSIRIAKTERPDTLGFTTANAIRLEVHYAQHRSEYLSIGLETIENGQGATFVQFQKHEGIYLAENHLRGIFSKTLMDFRNAAVIQLKTDDIREFIIFGQNLDSLAFQKNDSTGNWESTMYARTVTNDSIQQWLAKVAQLKKLPFADLFDESHANKTFFAQIDLGFSQQAEPLTLKIYRIKNIHFPEEMPDTPPDRSQFAPFVLYFSQYPTNYFALSDTFLLQQICQPF